MRLLIPIDFSGCALNALRYGVRLASDTEAEVIVLHCYHLPMPPDEFGHPVDGRTYEDVCQEKFEKLRINIPEIEVCDVEFKVEMGLLSDVVDALLLKENITCVVMGTTGTSGILKVLFGSNAKTIISRATCPVIAVPEGYVSTRLQNLVYATDLQLPGNEELLDTMKELALLYHAKIYLLNVSENPSEIGLDSSLEALNLEDYFKDINHEFCFLPGTNVNDDISQFVDDFNIDLLVMRPGNHSWLGELMLGSYTGTALAHTKIPLMTVHNNYS